MKRIVLHIGSPKSGTTTLQHLLVKFEDELLREGVLYPRSGRTAGGAGAHHLLCSSVRGVYSPLNGHRPWSDFLEELGRAEARTIVISSEEFGRCSESEVLRVRQYLEAYPVTVLVYLRNPLKFMVSWYKQNVKMGHYGGTFGSFIREQHHVCDYGRRLERWVKVFGQEQMMVRIYDKVKSAPSLEEDFLNILDVEPGRLLNGPAAKKPLNVSPADEAVLLMARLNTLRDALGANSVGGRALNRLRSEVLKRTAAGRALLAAARPLLSTEVCTDADIGWLRSRVSEHDPSLLDGLLRAEDRVYFDF
jgi:hypothetical protein